MSSLGHEDDIEVDCAEPSIHVSPVKPIKWQKENLTERNDSGFHSQDLDSVNLNSGRQDSHHLTKVFEHLDITDAEPKCASPLISSGSNPETSVLRNSSDSVVESSSVCDTKQCNSPPSGQSQEHPPADSFHDLPPCDAVDIFSPDEDGDTQLHMAIIQLSEPAAVFCMSRAPSSDWLNLQNNMCQSPLHLAVITRQPKVVRRLMAAGAAVDLRDLHGNTPLHIACREGHREIVSCLLKPVYYEETLENKYKIPFQRIPQDLEYKNYDGHTCLHLAAQNLHIDVMDLLLKKGAKVNTQDGKSGRTVLHYAAETGNRALIHFILQQRKVNINCVTYGGLTPIDLAYGRGYTDIVTLLKDAGADYSSLYQMDDDSDDSEMYDDFLINGEPVSLT